MHLGSAERRRIVSTQPTRSKEDPLARVILNGDLLQNDLRFQGRYLQAKISPSEQNESCANLEPIAKKILGMIGGNHDELRTQEDATPILDIANGSACHISKVRLFKIPVGARPNGKPYPYTCIAHVARCSELWGRWRTLSIN